MQLLLITWLKEQNMLAAQASYTGRRKKSRLCERGADTDKLVRTTFPLVFIFNNNFSSSRNACGKYIKYLADIK